MRFIRDSHWLRHPRVWVTLGVLGFTMAIATWVFSRDIPTTIPDYWRVADVMAGEPLYISMPVTRHLSKECSFRTTRRLVDSSHAETILVADSYTSAEALAIREKESPGRLKQIVIIPARTLAGDSKLVTQNFYTCRWNPSTWLLPIEDTWVVEFNVLPAPQTPNLGKSP